MAADDIREGYQKYGQALVRKAERILRNPDDAIDVVHSLFADLASRGREGRSNDLPYLYRAVTNRCLNLIRDTKRRAELLEREGETPVTSARASARALSVDLLAKLTKRLGEKEMEVLICRFIDDMTHDEIAEHLGTSRRTIGKRLNKVRTALESLAGDAEGSAA